MVRTRRPGGAPEQALREPFADRYVVVFQADPCQQQAPVVEVDEGVVDDVERVGDLAEEAAQRPREAVGRLARGAEPHQQREGRHGAERVVDSVHPAGVGPADAGHGEQRHDRQTAPPEGAADAERPAAAEEAVEEQSGREGEQHAEHAAEKLHARERVADADVAQRPECGVEGQPGSGCGDQRGEGAGRQAVDEECIAEIGDVLEEQRPARAVERVHLAQTADLAPHGRREEQGVEQRGDGQRPEAHGRHVPHGALLHVEHRAAEQRPEQDHRVQAHETPLEELPGREVPPAVVVGVSDDEAREDEEEVDGQVAVVDALVEVARGVGLEQVEADDHEGRHAAQSVEDRVVGFRIGEGAGRSLWHGVGGRLVSVIFPAFRRAAVRPCVRRSGRWLRGRR